MEDAIRWNHVVESLCATLCIHRALHIGEFAQEVETIEHDGQLALHQTLCQSGIPHQLVRVHRRFAVATTAVHRDVCRYLEIQWQFQLCSCSVLEGIDVHGRETFTVAA